jgi:hypothetical protein
MGKSAKFTFPKVEITVQFLCGYPVEAFKTPFHQDVGKIPAQGQYTVLAQVFCYESQPTKVHH